MRRHRQAASGERGGALVEFALVAPILVMLLLGTITLGLSFGRSNSLSNGARESARFAATLPVDSSLNDWLHSVIDVARDSTSGDLDASAPDQQICVAYVYPDGSDSDDRTVAILEVAGSRMISPGGTCFNDGRPTNERRVQVHLQRSSELQTVVYARDLELSARSVARFERA